MSGIHPSSSSHEGIRDDTVKPGAVLVDVQDECCYTFDTPFSEKGLCVNLKTWCCQH